MPATVFTICDLPHNQGYGSAANASGKLSLRFLQALAVSVINQLAIDFASVLDDFSNVKLMKESQSSTSMGWKNLSAFVDGLAINSNEEVLPSPSVLAKKVNFSTIAVAACQTVTLANQKIKKDVHLRLQNLYCQRLHLKQSP